jgi:hypothetical protein
VKTDIGQVDLVLRLSGGTSEKIRDYQTCRYDGQIYNHDDSITLQQDLDNLAAWKKMRGMQFHPEKVKYYQVSLYARV